MGICMLITAPGKGAHQTLSGGGPVSPTRGTSLKEAATGEPELGQGTNFEAGCLVVAW